MFGTPKNIVLVALFVASFPFLLRIAVRPAFALDCHPVLFSQKAGNQLLDPLSGLIIDQRMYDEVWVGYPITEAEGNNNPGIHWCWRNTQGTGLGQGSCQSNALSTQYLSPIEVLTDTTGRLYAAAPFTPFTPAHYDTTWEIAPWLGQGWGERQCTVYGTSVVRATNSFTCNRIGVATSHTGQTVHVGIFVDGSGLDRNETYYAVIKGEGAVDFGSGWQIPRLQWDGNNVTGGASYSPEQHLGTGTYTVVIARASTGCTVAQDNFDIRSCAAHPNCVTTMRVDVSDSTTEVPTANVRQLISQAEQNAQSGGSAPSVPYSLCEQIPETVLLADGSKARDRCDDCQSTAHNGIWTAVGCIKTTPTAIIHEFMRISLGLAGGVALLMILAAGLLFTTSQGDVKRTGHAKELLTSAVVGLLFIIFSVTILQFIGVSILQIPGFGGQ